MATRTTAAVEQVIHTLAGDDPLNDRDLLQRFVADNDQAAFESLVRRHTGLVLGVCRRGLTNPQDAEDACQATFVILARKAKAGRWQPSIANWLYATARRVAHNARVAAERRRKREGRAAVPEAVQPVDTMTGRELLAVLDEELEKLTPRYREPLVLCYLEGLTRDEAAARLGVPAATMKSRLERGRKRLGGALTSRGCVLGGGLLALAATSAAKASSPRVVRDIVAATAGSPRAAVAALTQGVAVHGVFRKSVLALFAIAATAGLGIGLWSATLSAASPRAKPDKDAKPAAIDAKKAGGMKSVSGRVLGPDGKAVPNAVVALIGPGKDDKLAVQEFARADADGQFEGQCAPLRRGGRDHRTLVARAPGFAADWVEVGAVPAGGATFKLAYDDVKVHGRVVDLEGKPLPNAKVVVKGIETTPDGDLSRVFDRWHRDGGIALSLASKRLYHPAAAGLTETVAVDADGRFEISGVGRDRLLALRFEGNGIELATVRVVTRPEFDPKTLTGASGRGMPQGFVRAVPDVHGPEFTHSAKPDQAIAGTVTDAKTGKPLAGVAVSGHVQNGWYENGGSVDTDANGRYTLRGVGKAAQRQLLFFPRENLPYIPALRIVADVPGLQPITVDQAITRGVIVTGRITDKATGKPITNASVRYVPLAGNAVAKDLAAANSQPAQGGIGVMPDGRFRVTVLPGPGVILAQSSSPDERSTYTQVYMQPDDRKYGYLNQLDTLGEAFSAYDGHIEPLFNISAYKVVNPEEGADSVAVELQFDPGQSISGRVVGPDGKPIEGVAAYGLEATFSTRVPLKNGRFTAGGLDAAHPRTIVFLHEEKKLTGHARLGGDEKDPVVKLEPWGVLTGKVVNADGQPLAGVTVSLTIQKEVVFSGYRRMMGLEALPKTDKVGNFRIDVRFPGKEFDILLIRNGRPIGNRPLVRGVTVAPGAAKALDPISVPVED